ncbi:YpdA family putative bacillithiol disulfide reductase [Rufibacter glacialis]|uniref:YpdA family putative bacillithiol disulfide reductase n=1 Tax=Rufibacter glacialis TaxID=1259555 RepID=A0A5M8Q6J2_9BACT|nr:YpdA family putative bacillithiol disulfide reductase [Rufibacter glacialis]KAA6430728.1 YpdA family putative bacillithiol disulfide reductase [Rufibacter glacialis]GGK86267.1 pyridine nucleotide-disulfide oxidoreductase [Rufibacter glacialis]
MVTSSALDIVIIGAGPIGLTCGIEAQKAGLSYVILDKGALVNSLYNYPVTMTFFSTSQKLEIGGVPFISDNPKPRRNEALEYYRRVALAFNLHVRLFEEVFSVQKKENGFEVQTAKGTYLARKVIISTGFYDLPATMEVPGENLPHVTHYYKDPHYYALQKVVVVGASNSSVDAALETYRKGAQVTMVVRGPAIGRRVKYWVKPDIENRIAEGSITAHFNSCITAIRPGEVDIVTPDGPLTLENDFVLALTGYKPNFDLLRKFGVRLSEDEKLYPQHDPQTMETNEPGLYLAGVVCGGMDTHLWFIENSRDHAEKIVRHILAQDQA